MEATSNGLKKGAWTAEEDILLRQCIDKYGEGKWHQVPLRAGLNRCRKSCRLRWLNYLKPDIKKGRFSSDEVDLLLRLHKLLGNRWSLIAGRIPGRTANDIKNYWNTHLSKKEMPCKSKMGKRNPSGSAATTVQTIDVIKPQPRSFSKTNGCSHMNGLPEADLGGITNTDDTLVNNILDGERKWLEGLLEQSGEADVMDPAAVATDEAGPSLMNPTSSSMFDFEQLWSLFSEDTGDLD